MKKFLSSIHGLKTWIVGLICSASVIIVSLRIYRLDDPSFVGVVPHLAFLMGSLFASLGVLFGISKAGTAIRNKFSSTDQPL